MFVGGGRLNGGELPRGGDWGFGEFYWTTYPRSKRLSSHERASRISPARKKQLFVQFTSEPRFPSFASQCYRREGNATPVITSMMLRLALVAALVASTAAQAVETPCTVDRLERLPQLCQPDDTTQNTGGDERKVCCVALRFLNNARCFCRPAITSLSRASQSALVPFLAAAPAKCGVNAFVGEQCEALQEEVVGENRTEESVETPFLTEVDYADQNNETPTRVVTESPTQELTETPEPEIVTETTIKRSPPSPLAPTQPQVLVVPTPAPTPTLIPEKEETKPPPRCDASTLLLLVQNGCAGSLRRSAFGGVDGIELVEYSSSLKAKTQDCCSVLKVLDAADCFCEAETFVALRAFPANFETMFVFANDVTTCGLAIKGGKNCVPFPTRSDVGVGDITPSGDMGTESTPNQSPWPPYPPYPASPAKIYPPPFPPSSPTPTPTGVGETTTQSTSTETSRIIQKVCRPEALATLLESGCDVRLAWGTRDSSPNALRDELLNEACCENMALLNGALCFCVDGFSGGGDVVRTDESTDGSTDAGSTKNRKERVPLLLGATLNKCGFVMYATGASGGGDGFFGETLGGIDDRESITQRTCVPVSFGTPPQPPSAPRPPMPPAPPRPNAPPPSPSAPRGPTGKYFPPTTFRLPDCPYKTDTFLSTIRPARPAGPDTKRGAFFVLREIRTGPADK